MRRSGTELAEVASSTTTSQLPSHCHVSSKADVLVSQQIAFAWYLTCVTGGSPALTYTSFSCPHPKLRSRVPVRKQTSCSYDAQDGRRGERLFPLDWHHRNPAPSLDLSSHHADTCSIRVPPLESSSSRPAAATTLNCSPNCLIRTILPLRSPIYSIMQRMVWDTTVCM